MLQRRRSHVVLFSLLLFFLACPAFSAGPVPGNAPPLSDDDAAGLAIDIPEPPDAKNELPSPIPMIYEFVGGLTKGEYDQCLQHYNVSTLLSLLFTGQLKGLLEPDQKELYAYQCQAQRNEFRFLARMLNRLAKGGEVKYSNPRFQKNQCRVRVNLKTPRGSVDLDLYSRYVDEKWQVYDYTLNNKRYSESFKKGLGGVKAEDYIKILRPVYGTEYKYKEVKNTDFGFNLKVPDTFKVREKVSPALLFSVSGFDGAFLLHVQAASYDQPKSLKTVAAEIKQSIMPFKPKLFDQYKADIMGNEIGHVLFQFEKNGKMLYTHMMILPLAERLLVFNFYHNSLPLLKNMTNIREQMIDSLRLPGIQGGATEITIPADDSSLPAQTTVSTTPTPDTQEPPTEPTPPPDTQDPPPPPENGEDGDVPPPPPPPDEGGGDNVPPPPPPDGGEGGDVPPPPPPDGGEGGDVPPPPPPDGGEGGDVPPPPPPDGGEGGDVPPPPPTDEGSGDNVPPPPPSDESYKPPEEGGGQEVSF